MGVARKTWMMGSYCGIGYRVGVGIEVVVVCMAEYGCVWYWCCYWDLCDSGFSTSVEYG